MEHLNFSLEQNIENQHNRYQYENCAPESKSEGHLRKHVQNHHFKNQNHYEELATLDQVMWNLLGILATSAAKDLNLKKTLKNTNLSTFEEFAPLQRKRAEISFCTFDSPKVRLQLWKLKILTWEKRNRKWDKSQRLRWG